MGEDRPGVGAATGQVRLRTDGLTVRHGGVVALSHVSLQVHAGEVVGLIGPNGAGKYTLVDAVSGFGEQHRPVAGAGSPVRPLRAPGCPHVT